MRNKSIFMTKIGVGFLAAAVIFGGTLYGLSPRITERTAALKIVRGKLVDDHVASGVKMDAILPHVSYIQLPKFVQKTTVGATEQDDVSIRTKEKARIYGNFEVMYHIDNDVPDFGRIYTKWQTDDIEDLSSYINKYTVPAAIDVYRNVKTSDINDDVTGLGTKIAKRLQEILKNRGHDYIVVDDVLPSGVGLSGKANDDLEKIVSEERKLDLLKVQGQVADKSVAITEKQAAVTAKGISALRETTGIKNEEILFRLYYMQLLRDTDRIGVPFVAGPVPGTTVSASPVIKQPLTPSSKKPAVQAGVLGQ